MKICKGSCSVKITSFLIKFSNYQRMNQYDECKSNLNPVFSILLNDTNQIKIQSYVNDIKYRMTTKKKKPVFCQHKKWTTEEDNALCKLVDEYGQHNWNLIAQIMQKRNTRQCKERWKYYLNPNLNVSGWTKEEDELIIKKKEELGPKWTLIANCFENRTDAMIKTRYNALIRAQKKKKSKKSKDSETNNKSINNNLNVGISKIEPLNLFDFAKFDDNDDCMNSEFTDEDNDSIPFL